MRKIFYLFIGILALVSCQNELYKNALEEFGSEQGIYIVNKDVVQMFIEENKDISLKDLKIGLTQKVEESVNVSLEAGNQTQLDQYNKEHGTGYVLLPKEMYKVDPTITIEPRYTSVTIPIQLKQVQFAPGATYALPVKIVGGDVSVIKGQTDALIVFEQKVVTKVLYMNKEQSINKDMFGDDFKVPQWTLEFMVKQKSFEVNNRALCGTYWPSGAPIADEIFIRFGDVTIEANQLQIKTGASQIDVPSDKFAGVADTWYMFTFSYDGKKTYVYVNGVLVAEREIRTGSYSLTGFWLSEQHDWIREVRFYKIARTPQQIAANIWKAVDHDDDNLLFYFPMNGKRYNRTTGKIEENETKIWDWTKNENDLPMPAGAYFDSNGGDGFVFPPSVE